MKKHLLLILLVLPFVAFSQGRNQLTPTGFVASVSPFTTITGGTEQNMFADTLKANTMAKQNNYHFKIFANATTGVGLSNITVKLKIGATTITLINSLGITVSLTSAPFVIEGDIVNQGSGNAFILCKVSQSGNIPMNGITSVYTMRTTASVDFSTQQFIYVTGQLTGVGLGTTSIGVDYIKRNNL